MATSAPLTVVETPEFRAVARRLFDEENLAALIDHVALNPKAGDLVPGTGGVRKLRWGLEGRGKRGGARVLYYFHDETVPLFLLTAYAKNVRADLNQQERNEFRHLTKLLVERHRNRRTEP